MKAYDQIRVRTAVITDTFLGIESNILTFLLQLRYNDESGQGAGRYRLDGHSTAFIRAILEIVGVKSWEELKGKRVRVKASFSKVTAIGSISQKKKWLDFADIANKCWLGK